MNTWNGLPFPYWDKVYDSIRAALNSLILRERGAHDSVAEPVDTRGMAYSKAAMEALLQEPKINQPIITAVDIPRANNMYFDPEDGIDCEIDGRDNGNDSGGDDIGVSWWSSQRGRVCRVISDDELEDDEEREVEEESELEEGEEEEEEHGGNSGD
jgi:hypothetical protein